MGPMTALSPGQFPQNLFHGTTSPLEGDTLRPGHRSGASGYQDPHAHLGQSRKDYVSASEDESHAWEFAQRSDVMSVAMNKDRQRVHVLEPHPETKMGIEHVDHPELIKAYAEDRYRRPQPAGEWVAPSYKVKETLDIKPGRQGTFPQLNWNQFKKSPSPGDFSPDANHPYNPPGERSTVKFKQRRLGAELAKAEHQKISDTHDGLF